MSNRYPGNAYTYDQNGDPYPNPTASAESNVSELPSINLTLTATAPTVLTTENTLLFPRIMLDGIGFNRTNEMPGDSQAMADEWSFYDAAIINWTPAQNTKTRRTADVAAIINTEFKTYLGAYIDVLRIDREQARYTNYLGSGPNNDESVDIVDIFENEVGPSGGATWTPNDWFGHRNDGDYDPEEDGKEIINYTDFVVQDAQSRYAWERSAEYHIYEDLSLDEFALDFVFCDNFQPTLPFSETNTDFLRNGQGTIDRFDTNAVERRSQACVNVADYIRTEMRGATAPASDCFVVSNGGQSFEDGNAEYTTYRDAVQGIQYEHAGGHSVINDMGIDWAGNDSNAAKNWEDPFARFRNTVDHIDTLGPNGQNFSFMTFSTHDDNFQTSRMGLCTVLMTNAMFANPTRPNTAALDSLPGYIEALRTDEMVGGALSGMTEQQMRQNRHYLGYAVDQPQTAARLQGVWFREFENGVAFVNPKNNGAQTINIADTGLSRTGYHLEYINGTQDSTRNPGGNVGTSFNLAAGMGGGNDTGDGVILLWVAD